MTDQVQGLSEAENPQAVEPPVPRHLYKYLCLIIGIGALTYANSFEGVFVFDDPIFINANIQNLWNATVAGDNLARPLIGFTLGINYLISGFHPWSYHLLNLLVHLSAALALFGIVRRTLLGERLREAFGERASVLALVVALIWMVHPLQTQSVTYIIQRCESIMGLFYLMTLYCAMRSFTGGKKGLWTAGAILACAAGMLSKQVMVTAPIIVLLYDYLFISPSLKTALLKRRALYLGLSATWVVLAVTFIASPVNKTAGFSTVGPSSLQYFLSEFCVLVHYLRLAIYPDALAIDYGWKPAAGIAEVLPHALPIIALQLATLWGLIRRKPLAFLGAWFFGILAVTSSFMPFADLVFEHRMYLPLAAVVAAVVLGADALLGRWVRARRDYAKKWRQQESFAVLLTLVVLVMGLATLTVRRNMDYKSLFVLWQDTVNKQPENARAQSNFGKALVEKGQLDLAALRFVEALRYDPEYIEAHHNYGFILLRQGQPEKANYHLLKAIAARPNFPLGHCLLGYDYMALGKLDDAAEHFTKAIELQPDYTEAHYQLGMVYQQQGQFEKALASYRQALAVDPACLDALNELALLLIHKQAPHLRNPEEALQMAEKSAQLSERKYGRSLDALAQVYAELGRYQEALDAAQQAALSKLAREDREFATGVEARLKDYQEKVTNKISTAKKSGASS